MFSDNDRLVRLVTAVRTHGVASASLRIHRRLWSRWSSVLWLHEMHVWSYADLRESRPHLPLPAGLRVVRASVEDLPLLDQLDAVGPAQARDRLEHGAELWLVLDGDLPVYAGWVFHSKAPTVASRTGWVDLPPRVANPEDMVTAAKYRGKGLASAMYTIIFDSLQEEDRADRVVGKVPVSNIGNRKALIKSGWQEFALVDYRRVGPWRRTTVRPVAQGLALWLGSQLTPAAAPADVSSDPR